MNNVQLEKIKYIKCFAFKTIEENTNRGSFCLKNNKKILFQKENGALATKEINNV